MNLLKSLKPKIKFAASKFLPVLRSGGRAVLEFSKKHKVWAAVICIAVILILTGVVRAALGGDKHTEAVLTVQRRDIEEKISDSTVVEPNREYSVTASVSGEILADYFEEGDRVTEDQLLYIIDSGTLEDSIASADIAVAKAKRAYEDSISENSMTVRDYATASSTVASAEIGVEKARQAYLDAVSDRDDLQIKSSCTGAVTSLYVSSGDVISAGTKLADVTDTGRLKIKVPFNSADADNIYPGQSAALTLSGTGTVIYGTVVSVSALSESGGGFTSYRNVTIEADNPGGVSAGDTAAAMIGGIACGDLGTFENITEESITASVSGKISELLIDEGSAVYEGAVIAVLDSDDADSKINTARLSLDDAYEALEKAKLQQITSDAGTDLSDIKLKSAVASAKMTYEDAVISRDKLISQRDDYSIKAPITGTVVTKNQKEGDTAGGLSSASSYSAAGASAASVSSASSASAMAVIYDMSRLKCTLNVDEIDVNNVHAGQKVTITTDVNDKKYTGEVESVSVNGTAGTNGVTTYPVKINIIDFDSELLPGMNIEAAIVVSSVKNVLSIPVSSLNRGNTVYVMGDKTEEGDTAPEGYKTVSVTVGASDDEYIQIIDGLSEGDVIYKAEAQVMDMMQMMQSSGGHGGGEPAGQGGGPGHE